MNKLFELNDYELLYLIEQENDEALDLMFKKYRYLIYSKIKKFQIPYSLRDDFFQEGLIMLHKAIKTYKTDSPKTFNKYFDLLLERRFISLLRQNNTYQNHQVLMEEVTPEVSSSSQMDIFIPISMFSDFEEKVYQYKYVENLKVEEISKKLGVSPKQIYNATLRIKSKIRIFNKIEQNKK